MRWNILKFGAAVGAVLAVQPASAASPAVQAAESALYLDAGLMHTQYHENISPGDDESGFQAGLGGGGSYLRPADPRVTNGADFYAALDYGLSAGGITYSGHTQQIVGNAIVYAPLAATDNAQFNRIEIRLGAGFPLIGGAESIPFVVGGYQTWSRNLSSSKQSQQGEFYRSGMLGVGWKFDVPIGQAVVVSATAEIYDLVGGSVTFNNFFTNSDNLNNSFGASPEERIELGLDDAFGAHTHLLFKAFYEHFSYTGSAPKNETDAAGNQFSVREPSSTTSQFGANVGVGYSF